MQIWRFVNMTNIVGISDLNEQYELLKKEAENIAGDREKVSEIVGRVNSILDKHEVLREAAEDIGGLVSFVTDSVNGDYTWASEGSLAAVLGAFMYLIKSDDAINDNSPVIGYIDDLRVFSIAREDAKKELTAYNAWSAER